jgi:hypothetical protein
MNNSAMAGPHVIPRRHTGIEPMTPSGKATINRLRASLNMVILTWHTVIQCPKLWHTVWACLKFKLNARNRDGAALSNLCTRLDDIAYPYPRVT